MKFYDYKQSKTKSNRVWNFHPEYKPATVFVAIEVNNLQEVVTVLDALTAMHGEQSNEGKWSAGLDRHTSEFEEMLEYCNGEFNVCGYTSPTKTYHFEVAFKTEDDAAIFKLTYF